MNRIVTPPNFYFITVIFLLNLIPGLCLINEGIFHFDSIAVAQAVENLYQKGVLAGTANGRYGWVLINALLYLPFYLSGHNAELVTIFSGVLFHSLSAVALFLLIKELFSDSVQAFFGALLFSFIPFYFIPNTFGKEHGLAMFFILLSFYLVRRGRNTGSPQLLSWSSIAFLIALSVREAALVTLPLFIAMFFVPSPVGPCMKEARPLNTPKALAAWLAPLLIGSMILFAVYLWPVIFNTLTSRGTFVVSFLGLNSFVLPIAIEHLFYGIPLLFFALAAAGIYQIFRHHRIYLGCVIITWSMLLFYFGNTSGYAARHLDIIAVPLCIAASYMLRLISETSRPITVALLLYCLLTMFCFMYPILEFRHRYNGKKQFAHYISTVTGKNAVVVSAEESYFISYYSGRGTIWFPVEAPENYRKFVEEVKKNLLLGVPVYYTNGGFDPEHEAFSYSFMNKFYKLTLIGERMNEDFNTPELSLNLYMQKLYKVDFKSPLK